MYLLPPPTAANLSACPLGVTLYPTSPVILEGSATLLVSKCYKSDTSNFVVTAYNIGTGAKVDSNYTPTTLSTKLTYTFIASNYKGW